MSIFVFAKLKIADYVDALRNIKNTRTTLRVCANPKQNKKPTNPQMNNYKARRQSRVSLQCHVQFTSSVSVSVCKIITVVLFSVLWLANQYFDVNTLQNNIHHTKKLIKPTSVNVSFSCLTTHLFVYSFIWSSVFNPIFYFTFSEIFLHNTTSYTPTHISGYRWFFFLKVSLLVWWQLRTFTCWLLNTPNGFR